MSAPLSEGKRKSWSELMTVSRVCPNADKLLLSVKLERSFSSNIRNRSFKKILKSIGPKTNELDVFVRKDSLAKISDYFYQNHTPLI